MANPNNAFGGVPVSHLGQVGSNTRMYAHPASDSTALYRGDAVKSSGGGIATGAGAAIPLPDGVQYVIASGSVTTGLIRGFITSFQPTYSNVYIGYCPASTLLGVNVADDPYTIFDIQANATAVTAAMIGQNIQMLAVAGSTTTNQSSYWADAANVATSANVLRILELAPTPGNLLGAYAILRVKINNHELLSTTGNS